MAKSALDEVRSVYDRIKRGVTPTVTRFTQPNASMIAARGKNTETIKQGIKQGVQFAQRVAGEGIRAATNFESEKKLLGPAYKPVQSAANVVRGFYGNVPNFGSYGMFNPTKQFTQKEKTGLGYNLGSVGAAPALFINPISKGLGAIEKGVGGATRQIVSQGKNLNTLRKIAPAIASEAVQTGALTAGSELSNQKSNPNQSFAIGLGLRTLGPASQFIGKGINKTIDPHTLDEVDTIRDALRQSIKKNKGIIDEQLSTDVSRLANKYLKPEEIEQVVSKFSGKNFSDAAVNKKLIDAIANKVGPYSQQYKAYKLGLIGEESTQVPTSQFSPETTKYLESLKTSQKEAKAAGKVGIKQGFKDTIAKFKSGLVDEQAAIEDLLSKSEKQYKYKVRPEYDIRVNGIDRVLKARELAGQFVKDKGLLQTIRDVPDENALNQYLIAKHGLDVVKQGKVTGRNIEADKKLIEELGPQFEPYAQKINQYTKDLLDYAADSGLVSKKLAEELKTKYPNYVPLNRVFSQFEEQAVNLGRGPAVASLGRQTVVQKLKGSEREIANPLESLLERTQTAFVQGEKNKTAKMLAQYKDLPGFEGLIKEGGEGSTHTFSYLDDGVKKTFETTPEIEAAAKNLNREQMNIVVKLLSYQTRALQLGATGLNLPFVVTNMVKDELTGFINSRKALKTSAIANPVNFVKSLFSTLGEDQLFDEVVRSGGMGTTFDITRQAPELTVEAIRSQRNSASRIKYLVKNPKELLRATEDLVGITERLGRVKNYAGTKEALLKEGRTLTDAQILAGQAARENTANFARKGSWGRVLNYMIPFFNAGIQGSRQLVKSFQNNPKETSAKLAVAVFTPIAAATAWNMSDPERKRVYEDISQREKESNIILIPENPTQDAQGRWNVIKIPLPPGLSNLASLVRRPMEAASGLDPVKFGDIAGNLITAGTSVDVSSPSRFISSTVPQALKVPAENVFNKNFYTGRDIVPTYMQNKSPEDQVYDDTSGTARKIGGLLNTSPLKVQNTIQTSLGGLGSQLMNLSDTVLNKVGAIPSEQVGGENPFANIERRFSKSYGGEIERRAKESTKEYNSRRKEVVLKILSGDRTGAKALAIKYKIRLTNADVKYQQTALKTKIVDDILKGNFIKAKENAQKYHVKITNKDVMNSAKREALSALKNYKNTGDNYYKEQAKELKDKYGFTITNSEYLSL